jgi:hypothetical protein
MDTHPVGSAVRSIGGRGALRDNCRMALDVADTIYKFDPKDRRTLQVFIRELQLQLQKWRYPLTNRMYKIVGYAVGDEGIRGLRDGDRQKAIELRDRTYKTWKDLIDIMADQDLIATKIDSYIKFRPGRLGLRPKWFVEVNLTRPAGQNLAIRHIVPSHLLGYAAEQLKDATLIDNSRLANLEKAYYERYTAWWSKLAPAKGGVKGPTETKWTTLSSMDKRRRLWELMYNHPGNLWVGDSGANSTIGLLHGAVQSAVTKLSAITKNTETPPTPGTVMTEVKKSVGPALLNPRKGSKSLHDEIIAVVSGIVHTFLNDQANVVQTLVADEPVDDSVLIEQTKGEPDSDTELSDDDQSPLAEPAALGDLIELLQDVAANLDLDVPALADWTKVVHWRTTFETPLASLDEIANFLGFQFGGSLMDDTKESDDDESS